MAENLSELTSDTNHQIEEPYLVQARKWKLTQLLDILWWKCRTQITRCVRNCEFIYSMLKVPLSLVGPMSPCPQVECIPQVLLKLGVTMELGSGQWNRRTIRGRFLETLLYPLFLFFILSPLCCWEHKCDPESSSCQLGPQGAWPHPGKGW